MELVERYIYAVTKRLPEAQRADIEKELRSLIEDMLDERSGGAEPTGKDIEEALSDLGDPAGLADRYRGKNRYLIGPEYFDKYLLLLRIVLTASTFAIIISLFINYLQTPPNNIAEVFSNVIGSIIFALFQGFTGVTVIFALIECKRVGLKKDRGAKGEFKPSELPPIPVKAVRIKRSGPIVAIIFSVIFLTILNTSPQLFGMSLNGSDFVPVLDIDMLHSYMWLIDIGFACIILKHVLRIVYGKYVVPLAAGSVILDFVSLIIAVLFFSDARIWNADFPAVLLRSEHVKIPTGFDVANPMESVASIIVVICIFAFLVGTASMLLKTFRHRIPRA